MLNRPDRQMQSYADESEQDQRREDAGDVGDRLRLGDRDADAGLRAEELGDQRASSA